MIFIVYFFCLDLKQLIMILTILWLDRGRFKRNTVVFKLDDQKQSLSQNRFNFINHLLPLICIGLFGFEVIWQLNLLLYGRDLLFTILSIPLGILIFQILERLLRIAGGEIELMTPESVNNNIIYGDENNPSSITVNNPYPKGIGA